jgi:hypothetical protein
LRINKLLQMFIITNFNAFLIEFEFRYDKVNRFQKSLDHYTKVLVILGFNQSPF